MTSANQNISLNVRLAPTLTPAQESKLNYNKWLIGHDMLDLRYFLEAFGVQWWRSAR